jgi:thioredoxin-related protein
MKREAPLLSRRYAIAAMGLGLLDFVPHRRLPRRSLVRTGCIKWTGTWSFPICPTISLLRRPRARFAIMWGLKGCPACKRMHEVHLMDPGIEAYIRDNFEVLHLNHIGARTVTDFDGRKLGEKALGEAYGIRFTPTIQFFPEQTTGLAALNGQAREVARMPGLLDPAAFLAMFRYVREKGYETAPFPDWLKKQV